MKLLDRPAEIGQCGRAGECNFYWGQTGVEMLRVTEMLLLMTNNRLSFPVSTSPARLVLTLNTCRPRKEKIITGENGHFFWSSAASVPLFLDGKRKLNICDRLLNKSSNCSGVIEKSIGWLEKFRRLTFTSAVVLNAHGLFNNSIPTSESVVSSYTCNRFCHRC